MDYNEIIKRLDSIENIDTGILLELIKIVDAIEAALADLEGNLDNVFTKSKIKDKLTSAAISEKLSNRQELVSKYKREYIETFEEWSNDVITYKNLLKAFHKKTPGNKRILPLLTRCENGLQTLNERRNILNQWQYESCEHEQPLKTALQKNDMEIVIQVNKELGKITAYDDRTAKTYTIEELQNLALKDDNAAQKAMGDYFHEINNPDEALAWYRKAAENGHAKAQWHLGVRYFSGCGVKKDMSQAENWFRKSAEQGDAGGQHGLGGCYLAKTDFVNARHWFEKAAAQGHADAKSALELVSLMLKANYTPQQHEQYLQQEKEKKRIEEEARNKRIADFQGCVSGSVSAGISHTVGLKADGTVKAVGDNSAGQCDVSGWRDIILVSAGDNSTFGLKSDGTVAAAGDNSAGQCNVGGWRDIISISAKGSHIVGLKSGGTAVAAGDNCKGQCNVGGWRDIVSVSARDGYTVGVKSDGSVFRSGWDPANFDADEWRNLVSDYKERQMEVK